MTFNDTDSKQLSLIKVISRFLSGAMVGVLILLIPVTYIKSNNFEIAQLAVGLVLIIFCGLLSILWGKKFIETVTQMLNNTGL